MASDNPSGADNQQGSRGDPAQGSPLTPQRLHAELLATGAEGLEAYLQGCDGDLEADCTSSTVRKTDAVSKSSWRSSRVGAFRVVGFTTRAIAWIPATGGSMSSP